jgi:hypothetical protein
MPENSWRVLTWPDLVVHESRTLEGRLSMPTPALHSICITQAASAEPDYGRMIGM